MNIRLGQREEMEEQMINREESGYCEKLENKDLKESNRVYGT